LTLKERIDDRLIYDAVCIGAGGAGVTVAAWASKNGLSVALLSKEPAGYGNTRMSGGCIVFPGISEGDGEKTFYQDLMKGGEYINQEELVRIMASQGAEGILILEELGHAFFRNDKGMITSEMLTKWGGHSCARTISSPGKMGSLIGQVLRGALARSEVDLFEDTVACRLLVKDNCIEGVVCLDLVSGKVFPIYAKAVVLATGGLGWMYYPRTSNFRTVCGDGFALAFDAGCEMIDMEMVQFLPFSFTHPSFIQGIGVGDPMAAGPYGRLINKDGEVVLEKINVLTRAQVAKVIALEIARGKGTEHGGLILDLRGNLGKEDGMKAREPWVSMGLFDPVREVHGIEAFRWEKPWDVAPTAHFMMGGVKIDAQGRSTVNGLFAVGEVRGGLHGANRLGSVALAEIFISGKRTADMLEEYCKRCNLPEPEGSTFEEERDKVLSLFGRKGRLRPILLKKNIHNLMWETIGPVREKMKMEAGLAKMAKIESMLDDLNISPYKEYNLEVLDAIEAEFMVKTAKMITTSALVRQESRGAHTRLDFSDRDDRNWLGNIVLKRDGAKISWHFLQKRN
jgi:fumarate reductase (CoM/CoB) subunit A